MPDNYSIATDDPSEPRFSEEDLDAALETVRERAEKIEDTHELHAALMVETAEHMHRYLINEC